MRLLADFRIILYASERKIAVEVKAFAAGSRRIWSRGCKEKHPTMLKIATRLR